MRMCVKKKILLLLLVSITCSLTAQQKIRIVSSGTYVSRDLTPEQTLEKALDDAKKNALIKAGIPENISVSDFLYTFEDNEKFREIFQAFTSTETGGEIIVDSILSEERSFNEFGNMQIDVKIAATIFKHKEKKDPSFRINVNGIDQFYSSGSNLNFTFTPYSNGYLKIFNVTCDTSSILYPYADQKYSYLNDQADRKFESYKESIFPLNPAFGDGYLAEIDNPTKQEEFNLLIFVYTRKNIPSPSHTGIKDIMEWIYSIPPDERIVEQHGFIIRR